MSRLRITSHAVERYQLRWAPHLSIQQVRQELAVLAEDARPTKTKAMGGQELWASVREGSKVLFIVKRDEGVRICVTILPEGAGEAPSTRDIDEFMALKEENDEDNRIWRERLEREASDDKSKIITALRARGRLCDRCENGEAVRYSRMFEQRWCLACYGLKKKGNSQVGRCPLIEDWELQQVTKNAQ